MDYNRNFLPLFLVILTVILVSCNHLSNQIKDKAGVEMALIPAGEFEMVNWDELKNEKSLQTVYVEDFYMDVYEVTNQGYSKCVDAGDCVEPMNTKEYSNPAYDDHPVVFVTYDMASSYCLWREARLPTKAEWEKAAANELEGIEYFWGDVSPICQEGARMGAAIDRQTDYDPETQTVGSYPPNIFGLYDMTGGIWEWVQDKHALDVYNSAPDIVSFMRINRLSGYGPLYNRFVCSFRCARTP